jgi:hypothetical protein
MLFARHREAAPEDSSEMCVPGPNRFRKSGAAALFLFACLSLSRALSAQDPELDLILQKIQNRLESHTRCGVFTAKVESTLKWMDKNWKTSRTLVVVKSLTQHGEESSEEILRAVLTKKGSSDNITEKYKELGKEIKKSHDKTKKESDRNKVDSGGKNFNVAQEKVFPFGPENRNKYSFTKLADTVLDGTPVYAIQVSPKKKSTDLYEGNFYAAKESCEILMAELKPSKKPKYVKDMSTRIRFELLPGGYYVVKTYWMRVYAKFLFEKVRTEQEHRYEEYRFPAEGPAASSTE